MDFNWKTALPGGLQLLGSALTATGVGAGAGLLVSGLGAVVADALGVPHTHEAVVAAAQNLTPEQQAALLTLQETNRASLQAQVIAAQTAALQEATKVNQAELDDKASARSRDMELMKLGKDAGQNWRADMMLVGCYISIVVIVCVFAFGGINAGGALAGFLFTLGGAFSKNISTAFDFEFGSSRSSKEKDVTIAAQSVAAVAGSTGLK